MNSGAVDDSLSDSRVLSLATCQGLIRIWVFLVKLLKSFLQKDPSYFKGIPLSDEEFVFNIPLHATRDVAELEMSCLSESECVEYS